MSVGRQFKRQVDRATALMLLNLLVWVISKPKRLLITLLIAIILIFFAKMIVDETGETFYVNTNSLVLLDKPFGKPIRTLYMNDTLKLVREMSDGWMKIAVESDTMYFKDNYYEDKNLGYTYKIQKTPFTKWKALRQQKVSLNHPDGYFETIGTIMKNGDLITVLDYSSTNNQIEFKDEKGYSAQIPVEYVKIDWKNILRKYPKIQE